MRIRPRAPASSAFTLVELIISSALMAVILATAYLCLNATLSGKKLVETRAEIFQTARVALNLITADLRAACPLSPEFEFLGMQRLIGTVEADNLDFATHHYRPRRADEFDFCRISYFLEENPESGRFSLWRRRDPNPDPEANPLEGGVREEIAEGLAGLRFEYYDGFDWYDDWGDADGRRREQHSQFVQWNLSGMPEAVRITLKFDSEPSPQEPEARSEDTERAPPLAFQTVVRLNLSNATWPRPRSSAGENSASPATGPDGPAAPGGGN